MGRAVILTGSSASLTAYLQNCRIRNLQHSLCHMPHMTHLAAQQLDGIQHLKFPVRGADNSGISLLTAHCGIERRLFHKNRPVLSLRQSLRKLIFRGKNRNL